MKPLRQTRTHENINHPQQYKSQRLQPQQHTGPLSKEIGFGYKCLYLIVVPEKILPTTTKIYVWCLTECFPHVVRPMLVKSKHGSDRFN